MVIEYLQTVIVLHFGFHYINGKNFIALMTEEILQKCVFIVSMQKVHSISIRTLM